jgi:hypothetical protein
MKYSAFQWTKSYLNFFACFKYNFHRSARSFS